MNDPHELQDTLAAIQAELDKTVVLINRAVSGGPRGLLDVAQQLKVAPGCAELHQHALGVIIERPLCRLETKESEDASPHPSCRVAR